MSKTIDIICEYGHYVVYINGKFYCSADTHIEAVEELRADGII